MNTSRAGHVVWMLIAVAVLVFPFSLWTGESQQTKADRVALPVAGAASGGPSAAPLLSIETGMHTAMINRIAVDRDGRFLVTGSDDKTIRVWDLKGRQALEDVAAADRQRAGRANLRGRRLA